MRFLSRRLILVGLAGSIVVTFAISHSAAQLRVVTYNTNTFGTEGDIPGLPANHRPVRTGAEIVFEAIGEELVNGIARPADIILLQEQQQPDTTTQNLVDRLNTVYAGTGITYARGFEIGNTTFTSGFGTPNGGEIRQSVVYRTDSVQLINEESFGTISGTNQPRETLLHQFRPVGYGAEADLYIFNSHFEAGDNTGFGQDLFARENEATDIRNFIASQNLGSSNVIAAGDFNVDSNFETSGVANFGGRSSLQILTDGTDASGRLIDPINPSGANLTFRLNSSIAEFLTQSPSNGDGELVGGGIDDRFDFILQSDELLDGGGVAAIPGTYRTFGNNGSTFNDEINVGNTISINGLTSFTTAQVLNALESTSDHLPVIQDFQLPAILGAQLATLPPTVPLGANFNVDVFVENLANVSTSLGADELNFSVSVSGDLTGGGSGIAAAFNGPSSLPITLDTSTAGSRSGTVTVTTSSQGVPNSTINIPVSFNVGGVGGGPVFGVIASDNFESTMNLTDFSQSPAPGAFGSPADGFQVFQSGVSPTIPFALVDDSFSVFPADTSGIVDNSPDSPGFRSDAWFGIVDTENPDNPSGEATATWMFDISGAVGLEVSVDIAAIGSFDEEDSFVWTYSIDGSAPEELFTSSVDEGGTLTYTLADGDTFTVDDPLLVTNAQDETTLLTNEFQTISSLLSSTGDTLTLMLTAISNGDDAASFASEAYAFDNILIQGFTGTTGDFDQDGDVDGNDFLAWQRGFGVGNTLAEGDANGDGVIDQSDLEIWQNQFGGQNASQAAGAVPEPTSSVLLVFLSLQGLVLRFRGDNRQ